jgi:5'-nucleotidase
MIHRRRFLKQSSLALAASLLAPGLVHGKGKEPLRLILLHTNDTHSRIEPFPEDGRAFGGFGGMARRAAMVKQIRSEGYPVLLLDAGDIFQGTPYFNFFGGELEFKLMSQMGYDAATLGNHDFDNGVEGLSRMLPHATFPFVCANYDFSDSPLAGKVKPHIVLEKGPIRIGIFGLGIELEGLVGASLYGNVRYQDPIAAAQKEVSALKAQGCHLILCLSHLGLEYKSDKVSDVQLAKTVDGIDVILGGHTHTFMEKPYIIASPDGHTCLIHQVGWAGINIGRLDITFSRTFTKKILFSTSMRVSNKSSLG